MNILPITENLAQKASHIYAKSWKEAYKGIVPQAYLDELSLERWTPILASSVYQGYVLEENGEYIATSSISPARDEEMQGFGEVMSIYVLPKYYNKGYGQKLFSFVLLKLKEMGFSNIYLWVLEDNKNAINFYKKNGFFHNGDTKIQNIGGKDLKELRFVLENN